jgi:hypothetical protein
MVVRIRLWKMSITRQAKLEGKLKVCHSIFYRDVDFGLARLAGPYLQYFPNTAKKECFLSLVKWYGRGVHVLGSCADYFMVAMVVIWSGRFGFLLW